MEAEHTYEILPPHILKYVRHVHGGGGVCICVGVVCGSVCVHMCGCVCMCAGACVAEWLSSYALGLITQGL